MWVRRDAAVCTTYYCSCVACAAGRIMLFPDNSLVLVKWRHRVDLHPEYVLLDVVRQRLDLISRMRLRRHRKY